MNKVSRKNMRFSLREVDTFKRKTAEFASAFKFFIQLENNGESFPFGAFQNIIAFDSISALKIKDSHSAFDRLKTYQEDVSDWIFGMLSYDLKNDIENLKSENPDSKDFPELAFFQAKHILIFSDKSVEILSTEDPETLFREISNQSIAESVKEEKAITLSPDMSREEYIEMIQRLRKHIYEGDIYEINFCIEYCSKVDSLNSYEAWRKLCRHSPTPFSAFFRFENNHLICASPERFIKKEKQKVISQPIKGTIDSGDNSSDREKRKESLLSSEKERAENMMIVDLVRNDLARTAKAGTVKVEELFGVYEFRHILHMISTISSEVEENTNPVDIIRNAFPMGSMTGAPKIKVMELIEKYERHKRGIFSGSVGYFDPDGNFDFNVIIRSLFYNSSNEMLSYNVGGAITYDSVPEEEYEECHLKAKAIREIFLK